MSVKLAMVVAVTGVKTLQVDSTAHAPFRATLLTVTTRHVSVRGDVQNTDKC